MVLETANKELPYYVTVTHRGVSHMNTMGTEEKV
jgi:hypothetical protein